MSTLRLATILAADVAAWNRLIGTDEIGPVDFCLWPLTSICVVAVTSAVGG
jgi:hypothetical protein